MIQIGTKAPDFALKDQNGKTTKLTDCKGKRVLLSFRSLAWTAVCRHQMRLLEENHLRYGVALGDPESAGIPRHSYR